MHIVLSSGTKHRLDALAQKVGCEKDGLVSKALEAYLDLEESQLQKISDAIETVNKRPESLIDEEAVDRWIDSFGSDDELPPPHLDHG
jgi:predicted transcriptional regulator